MRVRPGAVGRFGIARSAVTALPAVAPIDDVDATGRFGIWDGTPPAGPILEIEFMMTRPGFDADGLPTTYSNYPNVATIRRRLAYPNEATLSADEVALSATIREDDVVAGRPGLVSAADWVKPVANWARPDGQTLYSHTELNAELEVLADSGIIGPHGLPVACVEWTITQGIVTLTSKSSAPMISNRPGDMTALEVYRPSFDGTDFATLDPLVTFQVNCKVYPRYGNASAVRDTAARATINRDNRAKFGPRFFIKRTEYAPLIAYVTDAANGGNDGTGVVSTNDATARANPFVLQNAAAQALMAANGGYLDHCEIRVKDGTAASFQLTGSPATNPAGWALLREKLVIAKDPVTVGRLRIVLGQCRPRWTAGGTKLLAADWVPGEHGIVYRGIDFDTVTGGTRWTLDGALGTVHYDDSTLDEANLGAGQWGGNSASVMCTYMTNVDVVNVTSATAFGTSSQYEQRLWRGCRADWLAVGTIEWICVVGNEFYAPQIRAGVGKPLDGCIVTRNLFWRLDASVCEWAGRAGGLPGTAEGINTSMNIGVYSGTADGQQRTISKDSGNISVINHIDRNNTFDGWRTRGRTSEWYDDGPTARQHRNIFQQGNIIVQAGSKGDLFMDDAARNGNWSVTFQIDCEGNIRRYLALAQGEMDYAGLNGFQSNSETVELSGAPLGSDLEFVSRGGTIDDTTPGAGIGDYHIGPTSFARNRLRWRGYRWDIEGTEFPATNAPAGVYA